MEPLKTDMHRRPLQPRCSRLRLAMLLGILLVGTGLMLLGYLQMDPPAQRTTLITVLLAASGPMVIFTPTLRPLLESVDTLQASAQTVAAVAMFCLGSLLTLVGAVAVSLRQSPGERDANDLP